MKIDIGQNEAYVKISLQGETLVVSYGYEAKPIAGDFEEGNPEHESLGSFLCTVAGLATLLSEDLGAVVDVGATAIEEGSFTLSSAEEGSLTEFFEALSEEDKELMQKPTEGGTQ